jgi:hypothetical protein
MTASTVGRGSMVPGDERYERLKHQSLFLHIRGLMSLEMEEWERRLLLIERLTGKDASTLDPHLVDGIYGELEKAVMEQLRTSGLVERWLVSWETRSEGAKVHAFVRAQESPHWAAAPINREATDADDENRASRSLEDKLADLEHAVQLFSEHLAGVRTRDEPHSSP